MKQIVVRVAPLGLGVDVDAGFSLISIPLEYGGLSLAKYDELEDLFVEFFQRIVSCVGAAQVVIGEPTIDGSHPVWESRLRNGAVFLIDEAVALLRGMLRGVPLSATLDLVDPQVRVSVGFDFELTVDCSSNLSASIERLVPDGLSVVLTQDQPSVGHHENVADDQFWEEAFALASGRDAEILVIERFAYGRLGERWFRSNRSQLADIRANISVGAQIVVTRFPSFEMFLPRRYFDESNIQAIDRLELRYFSSEVAGPDLLLRPLSTAEFVHQPALWDTSLLLVPAGWTPDGSTITAVTPEDDGVVRARWIA